MQGHAGAGGGDPEVVVDAAAYFDTPSLQAIVAKDIAALRQLPENAEMDLTYLRDPLATTAYAKMGATLIPPPLLWTQDQWAVKAFVFLSPVFVEGMLYRRYQCALHRLDGTPCRAVIDTRTPLDARFGEHLLKEHAITEPPQRRKSFWLHGLLDCCGTTACYDFMLAPCCSTGRLKHITEVPHSYATRSLIREVGCCRALCCAKGCWIPALNWVVAFPLGLTLSCFPCVVDYQLRRAVVDLSAIDESKCKSCLSVCLCFGCSTIQVHRELARIGVWPGYTCFDRDETPCFACVKEPVALSDFALQGYFGLVTREDVVAMRQLQPARVVRSIVREPRSDDGAFVVDATVMR